MYTLDSKGGKMYVFTTTSIFGGLGTKDYEKLENKPQINSVELLGNKTSTDLGLQPAGNYLTEVPSEYKTKAENDQLYQAKGSYLTSETDPVFSASASAEITSEDITNWNNKSDFSGNYNDLSNKPTIPTALSDLSDDSTHRVVTDSEISTWNGKSNFSGSYNDLTDKPTIPTVPTNVSAFTNDAGYTTNTGTITSVKMNGNTISSSGEADLGTVITQHQDISGKLDTSAVKTSTNTTQGNVYDVTYINTMLGDVESLLSAI